MYENVCRWIKYFVKFMFEDYNKVLISYRYVSMYFYVNEVIVNKC